MRKITQLISLIFHPIFIPVMGLFVIFNSGTMFSFIPSQIKNFTYIIVFLSTFVLPLSMLPLLKFQRVISNYSLKDRRERILPMILSTIFFFMGLYILRKVPMTIFMQSFFLAMIVIVLSVALISFKWKISMHMSAIGAFTALIAILILRYSSEIFWGLVLAVFFSGVLGCARLYLGRHNPTQVYAGYIWGFIVSASILWHF